jgi:hypothetical protein
MPLVGFFDILGTREAIMSDRFSDLISLDFAGPVGLAARLHENVRFAVFSDSVIFSGEEDDAASFFSAVRSMYGQWYADFILVRGGIAEGEIRWVDYEPADALVRHCSNLMCSRVYGKGLVHAHELEQRCGPGAIAYLTERAASKLAEVDPNAVLGGISPMLCWASEREAKAILGYSGVNLEHESNEGAARRHALGTHHYWQQVVSQSKFLPELYEWPSSS